MPANTYKHTHSHNHLILATVEMFLYSFQRSNPLTVELYETTVSTEQPQLVYQSVINDGLLILEHCRFCESDQKQNGSEIEEKQSGRRGEQPGSYLGVK